MLGDALTAKVLAASANILDRNSLIKLIESESVNDFLSILKSTPSYAFLAPNIGGGVSEIESHLAHYPYAELERFFDYVGFPARSFVELLLEGEVVEVLKNILRLKHGSADASADFSFLRQTNFDVKKLMEETKSVQEVVQFAQGTPYHQPLVNSMQNFESTNEIFHLETNLDYDYSFRLREKMGCLSGADRDVASRFLGVEDDLYNVVWLYRGKFLCKLTDDEVSTFVIPYGYFLNKNSLQECSAADNVKDFERRIAQFGLDDLFGADGLLLSMSLKCRRKRRTEAAFLKKSPLGFLLWYWVCLRYETDLLINILEFIDASIAPDKRSELVKELLEWQ